MDNTRRARSEAQLAAPVKRLSMSKAQKKKLAAAAAAAAAAASGKDATATASDTAPVRDTDRAPASAPAGSAAPAAGVTTTTNSSSSGGPTFLSLGLSPLHQMDNSQLPHCSTTHRLLEMCYEHGAGVCRFVGWGRQVGCVFLCVCCMCA
jgi:hypothetical protein